MADTGKSSGRSTIVSRYGLISIGNRPSREARDCGWESSDGGDSLSYSD
jgi:hypothetical protein